MGHLARMQTLPYYNYNKILKSDYVCHTRVSGQYMCHNVSVALEWVPLNEKKKQQQQQQTNKQKQNKTIKKKPNCCLSVHQTVYSSFFLKCC